MSSSCEDTGIIKFEFVASVHLFSNNNLGKENQHFSSAVK